MLVVRVREEKREISIRGQTDRQTVRHTDTDRHARYNTPLSTTGDEVILQ